MKKLVFTVFAVMAFSGVSMANNTYTKVKVLDENILFFTECENWAMDQMAMSDPQDQMSPEEAHDEFRYYVELCDSH